MLKVAFPVDIHSPRATYEIQYGHLERPDPHQHQLGPRSAPRSEGRGPADLSETGLGERRPAQRLQTRLRHPGQCDAPSASCARRFRRIRSPTADTRSSLMPSCRMPGICARPA